MREFIFIIFLIFLAGLGVICGELIHLKFLKNKFFKNNDCSGIVKYPGGHEVNYDQVLKNIHKRGMR